MDQSDEPSSWAEILIHHARAEGYKWARVVLMQSAFVHQEKVYLACTESSRAFVKAPAATKPLENFLKQNYIFGKSL